MSHKAFIYGFNAQFLWFKRKMGQKPKNNFLNPPLAVPGPVNRSEPVRNVMPKSIFDSPVTSEAKSMSKSIFDSSQKEERLSQKSTIQNVGQKSNQANETQKSNTGIIEEALNHHFFRKISNLTLTLSQFEILNGTTKIIENYFANIFFHLHFADEH